MATGEVHLDEATYARAKKLADAKRVTVEEIVSAALEQFLGTTTSRQPEADSLIGLFADAPDLLDQIVERAYRDREQYPLRQEPE